MNNQPARPLCASGLWKTAADTHTRNMFKKLGVHSRAAAVAKALRDRLV